MSGSQPPALQAVTFLTALGRGKGAADSRSLKWYPVVGLGLGGVLGGLWWGLTHVVPPFVGAFVVVSADLGLTGMLHFDGLIDSADGLLPHLPVERRLEVMAAPEIGAFGAVTGASALIGRVIAVANLPPSSGARGLLVFVGLWALSRSVMALAVVTMTYRRPGGLAGSLRPDRATGIRLAVAAGLVAAVVAEVAWRAVAGAVVAAAAFLAAGAVLLWSRRRLGGFTGDVLGAAGVLSETVGLLVAAARWG